MDPNMFEQLRTALQRRLSEIGLMSGNHLMVSTISSEDVGNGQSEMIDIAQTLEQLGRDNSLAEQERRELLAIERALAKMSTGTFGVCEDCGEAIPTRRLMVLPEARLCANCQTVEERQNSRTRTAGMGFR